MVNVSDSKNYKVIGTNPIRHDGYDKVTGRAIYGADIKLPGLIWASIVRSPHAHAVIKSVDTSAAEKVDGVFAVMTGKDLPHLADSWIDHGEGTENIKPLYGRQTYRGSNQWNYFTSLDSHLATKIPVYMGGQDCTDERGCKELYKGENVNMGEDGTNYSASIFNNKTIRYIPYI